MNRLYVLYVARCGLCQWAKDWASARPAFVPLEFIPAGSVEARVRFPGLAKVGDVDELVAVSDEGHVYRNDAAWIMCLYALVETREWSLRLGSPLLRPLARHAFTAVSHERGWISHWLGLGDDGLASRLRAIPAPACEATPAAPGLHFVPDTTPAPPPPGPEGPVGVRDVHD